MSSEIRPSVSPSEAKNVNTRVPGALIFGRAIAIGINNVSLVGMGTLGILELLLAEKYAYV